MSKVDLKKAVKIIFNFCTTVLVFLLVVGIINEIFFNTTEASLKSFLGLALVTVVLEVLAIGIVYLVYFIENKEFMKHTDTLERNIPKEIPPAIASVLLDFFLDNEQDYLSTVSSLISKGYIELIDNKEIKIKNDNLQDLLSHEKLAFEIVSRKRFYNEEEFRNKTIADAKKIGVIERTNRFALKWKSIGKSVLYTIALIIISIIGIYFIGRLEEYGNFKELFWIVFWAIYLIFAYKLFTEIYIAYSYNSPKKDQSLKYLYRKTKKGEEYAEMFTGLKTFFQEYTLMNEKELESIKIYDDYIPYAIALGEAEAIAKFIEQNGDCSKLIYRV